VSLRPNDSCPCGSDRRFKKCCLEWIQGAKQSSEPMVHMERLAEARYGGRLPPAVLAYAPVKPSQEDIEDLPVSRALEAQYRAGYQQGYRDAVSDAFDKRLPVRSLYRHIGHMLDGWGNANHRGEHEPPPQAGR
jgi:hypothetical protein